MSKLLLGFLCITCLCSCGFFERKPLTEDEIKNYIFSGNALDVKEINHYSKGAVGGYSFVVRIKVDASDEAASMLSGFSLNGLFADDDPGKKLLTEIFKSNVEMYFSGVDIPIWIPESPKCKNGVSQYTKQDDGLTIYAYHGVGACDEIFFFGTLD